MKRIAIYIALIGVIAMSIYSLNGNRLNNAYKLNGEMTETAYSVSGDIVFPDLPILSGDLTASQTVALPDIYNNGHGWTCTGLDYDDNTDTFLVGDIGKELPSSSGFASKIIRVSSDFGTAIEQIPLYTTFPNMQDVQGIAIDPTDGTIWFCSTSENLIRHIDVEGNSIGSFQVKWSPTGIAYSPYDDTFWILTYDATNNIKHISKTGTVLEQYSFAYSDTLDQCFLDAGRGYLYIDAGTNYSGRNSIYKFDTNTHQQSIACTVDSYSVEGLWIGQNKMVIVNDGYYHSAVVQVNQANIYDLS